MVVYVEYVLLNNLIIDAFLVSLARKSLKLEIKRSRVFISSLFGAIVAVLLPLMKLSVALLFLLKMPIGMAIILISGKFQNFREFIYCFYLFLFFTFLLGGGVIAVFWGLGLNFDPLTYSGEGEGLLLLSLITATAVYFLAKKLINRIYKRKDVLKFTRKCQFVIGDKEFEFIGFLDSGNNLCYGDGCPVVVCGEKACEKLKNTGVFENSKKDMVFINTVGGKTLISVYKTQKFLIYNGLVPNIFYNVMLGVPSSPVDFYGYDVLLGGSMA